MVDNAEKLIPKKKDKEKKEKKPEPDQEKTKKKSDEPKVEDYEEL